MPVEIVEHPTNKNEVCVRVSPPHDAVRGLLDSMLLTRYFRHEDYWIMPVVEFPVFKSKLEEAGVKDGRSISTVAWERVSSFVLEQERLEAIKHGKNDALVKVLLNGSLKTEPYPDQITGIAYGLSCDKRAILDWMGIGKCMQSLSIFAIRKKLGLVDRGLVLCPNNVKETWLKEITKHTSFTALDIGNGTKTVLENIERFKEGQWDFLIVHYDVLRLPVANKLGKIEPPAPNLPVVRLGQVPFDQIIVDELHLLKHKNVLRSRGVEYLLSKIKPLPRKLQRVLVDDNGHQRWVQINPAVTKIAVGQEIDLPL